jgi:hypothetical protein
MRRFENQQNYKRCVFQQEQDGGYLRGNQDNARKLGGLREVTPKHVQHLNWPKVGIYIQDYILYVNYLDRMSNMKPTWDDIDISLTTGQALASYKRETTKAWASTAQKQYITILHPRCNSLQSEAC